MLVVLLSDLRERLPENAIGPEYVTDPEMGAGPVYEKLDSCRSSRDSICRLDAASALDLFSLTGLSELLSLEVSSLTLDEVAGASTLNATPAFSAVSAAKRLVFLDSSWRALIVSVFSWLFIVLFLMSYGPRTTTQSCDSIKT